MLNIICNEVAIQSGNIVFVMTRETDIPSVFDNDQKNWISSRIEQDKHFIHVNLYHRQAFIVVVPKKKHEWQITEELRRKGVDVLQSLNALKQETVGMVNLTGNTTHFLAVVEGMYLASYQFLGYFKDMDKKRNSMQTITVNDLSQELINEYTNLWQGVFTAKELVNEPVIALPSSVLVEKISTVCNQTGMTATVYDKTWLTQQGMGGILSVNKGSVDPPYLCVMEWNPVLQADTKPLVLVGKGVTYDTGGLSLKTSQYMETMKADMSGAAAVVGTMKALATNNVPLRVVALIPITDNRPGFNAYAPGDIVKMHNGLHVEVLNTDAEGRMLLADALSWAKTFDPVLVVDIATLTGSANAAVGEHAAATMGTATDAMMDTLVGCSMNVHERLVRFPLWDDYADQIKSDIADLKNVGGPLAGAITAAKFLENFTSYPWIHIDIAGSAYNPRGADYRGKGATGMGVRLLYSFLKTFIQ